MAEDIRTSTVNLLLGSRGITVDRAGRIEFDRPEILQAILTGAPGGAVEETAADSNYVQCSCNNYQCGKVRALAERPDVVSRDRG